MDGDERARPNWQGMSLRPGSTESRRDETGAQDHSRRAASTTVGPMSPRLRPGDRFSDLQDVWFVAGSYPNRRAFPRLAPQAPKRTSSGRFSRCDQANRGQEQQRRGDPSSAPIVMFYIYFTPP